MGLGPPLILLLSLNSLILGVLATENIPCNALNTEFVFKTDACKDEDSRFQMQALIAATLGISLKDVEVEAYDTVDYKKASPSVLIPKEDQESNPFTEEDFYYNREPWLNEPHCWAKIWGGGYYTEWTSLDRQALEAHLGPLELATHYCEHQPGHVVANFVPVEGGCLSFSEHVSCDILGVAWKYGDVLDKLGILPKGNPNYFACTDYVPVQASRLCRAYVGEETMVTEWADGLENSLKSMGYEIHDLSITCSLPADKLTNVKAESDEKSPSSGSSSSSSSSCQSSCQDLEDSCETLPCCSGYECNGETSLCEEKLACSSPGKNCENQDCCHGLHCDEVDSVCVYPLVCHGPGKECLSDSDCCRGYECLENGKCGELPVCAGEYEFCIDKECCGDLICEGASSTCFDPANMCAGYQRSCDGTTPCCPGMVCNPLLLTCQLPAVCEEDGGECANTDECCGSLICSLEEGTCVDPASLCGNDDGASCEEAACCPGFVCNEESLTCENPISVCALKGGRCSSMDCCRDLTCSPDTLLCEDAGKLVCADLDQDCVETPCCEDLVCHGASSTCLSLTPDLCGLEGESCASVPCCNSLTCEQDADPEDFTCVDPGAKDLCHVEGQSCKNVTCCEGAVCNSLSLECEPAVSVCNAEGSLCEEGECCDGLECFRGKCRWVEADGSLLDLCIGDPCQSDDDCCSYFPNCKGGGCTY